MGKSSISGVLSAQIRNEIIAEVQARASSLNLKKGTYTAMILEWWYAQGCPAVTDADRAVQLLRASEKGKAGKKSA